MIAPAQIAPAVKTLAKRRASLILKLIDDRRTKTERDPGQGDVFYISRLIYDTYGRF
jgi:hypothetical protein